MRKRQQMSLVAQSNSLLWAWSCTMNNARLAERAAIFDTINDKRQEKPLIDDDWFFSVLLPRWEKSNVILIWMSCPYNFLFLSRCLSEPIALSMAILLPILSVSRWVGLPRSPQRLVVHWTIRSTGRTVRMGDLVGHSRSASARKDGLEEEAALPFKGTPWTWVKSCGDYVTTP